MDLHSYTYWTPLFNLILLLLSIKILAMNHDTQCIVDIHKSERGNKQYVCFVYFSYLKIHSHTVLLIWIYFTYNKYGHLSDLKCKVLLSDFRIDKSISFKSTLD